MEQVGEFTNSNLIADSSMGVLVKGITLARNQGLLSRGTVVGIQGATGLAKVVDSQSVDGSEVPYGILTDPVDTDDVSISMKMTVYISGVFNSKELHYGGSDSAETHEEKLRKLGIFLK